ncbi:four-carbon acid sugar kinase family protein [Spirosoma sp. BT702]|uniref:Four-carbon acid sugar kinase family protein n=1 Tax=Spirosoma profusum TaxID=2771354 RepID=A0A927GA54_9BACT|nr:four-carbon acid sugar kinase family protein [Spirosoma profusum]MBD2705143.1 four-carbon acid sugar kinase family protein [Spirosoma profusum]
MVAVIADDLTGAAELAGIGLSFGLTVELAMSVNPQSTAELIVIATDARSVSESEAVQEMSEVSATLRTMKPQLIFKKTDSVLRGYVIAEAKAQLDVLDLEKALIVPANPALGRMLIDGHYYVQGQLIHQTHFSTDPEFPIIESDVLKRLSVNDVPLTVQPSTTASLQPGIVIGEAGTQGDLKIWAGRIDEQTLPGGGAGFFEAVLGTRYVPKRIPSPEIILGNRKFYVCGTAFGRSVELVKKAAVAKNGVSYMPKNLLNSVDQEAAELANWVERIVACFERHDAVIIAIESNTSGQAIQLRSVMAKAVKQVLDQVSVDELIIEGGSTASAVLREIGVTQLAPTHELATGVVRSAAIDHEPLYITMKPGSYRWPTDLWSF